MTTGATVSMIVPHELVGRTLHQLEQHADVFLVERNRDGQTGCETWWLRSDKFPSDWNGQEVAVFATDDPASPLFFNLLVTAK